MPQLSRLCRRKVKNQHLMIKLGNQGSSNGLLQSLYELNRRVHQSGQRWRPRVITDHYCEGIRGHHDRYKEAGVRNSCAPSLVIPLVPVRDTSGWYQDWHILFAISFSGLYGYEIRNRLSVLLIFLDNRIILGMIM